jgi:hypothetical protein
MLLVTGNASVTDQLLQISELCRLLVTRIRNRRQTMTIGTTSRRHMK